MDNRNRVALSKDVLSALDVAPGDYVTFLVDENGAVRIHKLNLTVAPAKRPSGPGRSA